jgi:hypothetical protein
MRFLPSHGFFYGEFTSVISVILLPNADHVAPLCSVAVNVVNRGMIKTNTLKASISELSADVVGQMTAVTISK